MKIKIINIIKTINILIIICFCSCSTNVSTIKNNHQFNSQQFPIIWNKITDWQLKGKISWQHYLTNKSANCYVNWQKSGNKSVITFYSPLNIKNLTIEVIESYNNEKNNQIKILSKNGKNYNNIDNDPDINAEINQLQLAIDQLSLNINNLTYWILGVPHPLKKYTLLKNGFKQDDWLVNYKDYQQEKLDIFHIPRKIIIKNIAPNLSANKIGVIKIIIIDFNQKY